MTLICIKRIVKPIKLATPTSQFLVMPTKKDLRYRPDNIAYESLGYHLVKFVALHITCEERREKNSSKKQEQHKLWGPRARHVYLLLGRCKV